jgi:RHS repeat-associated protein
VVSPITQRDTFTTPAGKSNSSQAETKYDSFGNVTESKMYDYGSVLISDEVLTYGSYSSGVCSNTAMAANFIHNRICTDIINTNAAQTNYTYDAKGNLLTFSKLVGGTTYLTKTFTHNATTGALETEHDVNGTLTTYTNAACNGLLPTTIAAGGLSQSMTWDCNGGVITASTDANGKVSHVDFVGDGADPFWRPETATDPAGVVTTFDYTPTSVETAITFNNGNSTVDAKNFADILGRPNLSQKKQSPSAINWDTTSKTFDPNGRPFSVSMPCAAGAGSGCSTATTTQTYDALNRPLVTTDGGGGTVSYSYSANDVLITVGPAPLNENSKKKQMEYDGLGRLTSVCEITSASGSATCGQTNTKTGYWTKYAYDALGHLTSVTQNAQAVTGSQQTRSYAYDSVGRLTSEANPENGTTTYTYDSVNAGNCVGTNKGDLMLKVDAAGNGNYYVHDGLHRLLSIGQAYNTSPNASVTPDKCFVYDSAVVNSTTTQNTKGRVAEAFTTAQGSGCGAAKITDIGFSYSARGELTDVYESTPHSSGYYHTTASYWANGALNTLGGVPGHAALWTFSPDGKGRISTISDTTNLVTATGYNSASQVTAVTFGSGDNDAYTFDPNTGRMTQYQFNIGATVQSVIGNLTWNPNGTLKTLAITDPFNAPDTQTCNYLYDDLERIGNPPGSTANSVDCGSIWQQKFTYDAFGNISKSGSSAWQATYSGNRTQTIPGCALPTGHTDFHDANGNLLTDCTHTYTWDADNHAVGIDSISLTYDALGRMVEQNNAGVFTEILYSPIGKLAVMNGQSFTRIYVPFPGGGYGVNDKNLGFHNRHVDWLGSERFGSTLSRTMDHDNAFAPYGENYAGAGAKDLDFTGQDQDTVSGVYDFLYREYSPTQGRWISHDPAGMGAVNPANPQTWNRYAYVQNIPLSSVDPKGLNNFTPWLTTIGVLGFGGLSGNCTMDSVDTPCSLVNASLQSGGAVQCANNNCGIGTATPYQCVGSVCGYMSNQYVATHENEVNGVLFTNAQYAQYLQGIMESQRGAIVDQLTQTLCAPGDGSCAAMVNGEVVLNTSVGNNGLAGGNYNFLLGVDIQAGLDLSGCFDMRCGGFDSLHFAYPGTVHLDTANPFAYWGLGAIVHGFVDVLLGNTILASGIPR